MMKFTNDITFNKLPRSNDILKITYSGNLFKDNSSEVYIVYGFGENWDNTTEQKMEKTNYGFVSNIKIESSTTFNFCFRNSNQIWDNNNSFNYISTIFSKPLNTEVQSLDNQEAKQVCSNSLDAILNSIDLELETSKSQNIEISEDLNVLDTLIQELLEEYNAKIETTENNIIQNSSTENTSLSNNIQEINSQTPVEEIQEKEDTNNIEYFSELSNLFDEIIQNIESNNSSETIDLGMELTKTFENTFTENFTNNEESTESYTPEPVLIDSISEATSLNETFSDIIKNISEIETKTNTEVKNLNYDYSDFNAMFAFAQNLNTSETENTENKIDSSNTEFDFNMNNVIEEIVEDTIFDFSNAEFDFNMNNVIEEIVEDTIFDFSNAEFDFNMNNVIEENVEDTIFDFSNDEFDFNMNNIQNSENKSTDSIVTIQNSYSNEFSDSFYDDEDISTHENYSAIEEIQNTSIAETENEKFENVVNEYSEYFDNLIEEIVSTPTSTLSTPVSTAQVLENENTTLSVIENNSQDNNSNKNKDSLNTNGVPNEYALYDYSSHSFFYMFKRRVKIIFSTIFTKLPKIFGRQKNSENN